MTNRLGNDPSLFCCSVSARFNGDASLWPFAGVSRHNKPARERGAVKIRRKTDRVDFSIDFSESKEYNESNRVGALV